MIAEGTIKTRPVPLPATADAKTLDGFGVEVVSGFDPREFTAEEFKDLERLLYTHNVVLFRDLELTPEQQYKLTKAFDPTCESYGHGNNQVSDGARAEVGRDGGLRVVTEGGLVCWQAPQARKHHPITVIRTPQTSSQPHSSRRRASRSSLCSTPT